MSKNEKYITLKEAAEISGYAPDYVGQLIRKGKLPGKQIYHSVAWVTTEAALKDYLAKGRGEGEIQGEEEAPKKNLLSEDVSFGYMTSLKYAWQRLANRLRTEWGLVGFLQATLWVSAVLLACFALALFSIISVRLDKKIQERAMEKVRSQETFPR